MAAVLHDQDTGVANNSNTANVTITVTAGDRIIVCVREHNGTAITSVSSDVDGALTQEVNRSVNAANVYIWSLRASATGGNHVITVATAGGNTTFDFNASTWGGVVTTGAADTSTGNGGAATTTPNHGSITPSAAALIITAWGGGSDNGGETGGSDGMTALQNTADANSGNVGKQYYQYKVTHTGAIDGDFTTTNSVAYDGVIAAFLESGGGGGTPVAVFLNNLQRQGIAG
jgi:hypothetical protein